MNFTIERSVEILERTPGVLYAMLQNVSADWAMKNEGGETWSAYDVVGHLIYCERADWMLRAEIILSENHDKKFEAFDRYAHFEESKGKSLSRLLDEFKSVRKKNIERLLLKNLTIKDLEKKGIHPSFGEVTLYQLLATWVAHDLNHIAQIARVMAKQYKEDVGPWIAYLRILQ